jgi:uncharacterized protein YfaS (alpha-2-macroglobulin family)
MNATVRAVALAALAERGEITTDDIARYRTHVPQMSLMGQAHFALAALKLGDSAADVKETVNRILAHGNQSGGKYVFSESLDDGFNRIHASPMRENCAILSLFTKLGDSAEMKDITGDIPAKLVRTITQTRKGRDYWENTQENLFCMQALTSHSRVYEKEKPAMTAQAELNGTRFGEASFDDWKNPPQTLLRALEPSDVGVNRTLSIRREGAGRLYYTTQLAYSPMEDAIKAENAGIEIRREYSVERDKKWVLLKSPVSIKRGELVRVDLFLSLPAARHFVVVDDPVPGGLEPVNRDLATSSTIDADKGNFTASGGSYWFDFSDWKSFGISRWSFYHQEIRHHAVRYYSDYLESGNYHLSYTAQAVAEGSFAIPPVLAQEMYDPDVFGKGIAEQLSVTSP